MTRRRNRWIVLGSLLAVAIAGTAADLVPYERIVENDPADWLTYSGNYRSWRYSPLTQINTGNVANLRPAWIYQMQETSGDMVVETSPLVVDEIMYISTPRGNIEALDTKTGVRLWNFTRSLPEDPRLCCGYVNRGLAILGDLLFVGTLDAHLVAVDRRTGEKKWETEVADHRTGISITGAPLAINGKVIVGVSGGEFGIRGFLDAYNAATGEREWRFWTVPEAGQPGNETWAGESWRTGGGPTWITGSYDPELNLIYWGIGNPSPPFNGDNRAGDNLYTDSLLAINPDTGTLAWYFQFTPHDTYDFDSNQIPILADIEFEGRMRKVVMLANRNAFFYVLDRENGELLQGLPFARQTWALGLNEEGRPIPNPDAQPSEEGTIMSPHASGGTNWYSPSYSPRTGLFYVASRDASGIYYKVPAPEYVEGLVFGGGATGDAPGQQLSSIIRALDPRTGQPVWEYPLYSISNSGMLSTAGNVVFGGTVPGWFFALDTRDGRLLWRFNTGGLMTAQPISYMSEGKQAVAIAAGKTILAFTLPGN